MCDKYQISYVCWLMTKSALQVDSKDAGAQSDLSLRCAHIAFCWLCREDAHIFGLNMHVHCKKQKNSI